MTDNDYTLFLLQAEKNRREQEKLKKVIAKLTDEELELLIKQKEGKTNVIKH